MKFPQPDPDGTSPDKRRSNVDGKNSGHHTNHWSVRRWIECGFVGAIIAAIGFGIIYTQKLTVSFDAATSGFTSDIFNMPQNPTDGSSSLKKSNRKEKERLLRNPNPNVNDPNATAKEDQLAMKPNKVANSTKLKANDTMEKQQQNRTIPNPNPGTTQEQAEKRAKERFEREAKEKAENLAKERAEQKEKGKREASEKALQEAREAEEKQKFEQEIKERSAREASVRDDDRLNIVLFYGDDWATSVLGKINPNVHTPNIDRMADEGMLFINNCVTTSVCWVSRATLMTGLYYSRHLQGLPSQDMMFHSHNWNETLFPRLRRDAGYYTGMMGKWHAPQPEDKMKAAFDTKTCYFGKHWTSDFNGNAIKEHVTAVSERHAVEFLEKRPRNQKFALKVSFFATHAEDGKFPSYRPQNWSRLELYPDDTSHQNYQNIIPPKTATDKHYKDLPYFLTQRGEARTRWGRRWEPNYWQKNIRDLYAMATEVDRAVGEVIKTLRKQGILDETLLIFTTDNGDLHGEHGLAEKWFPFEESIKVPLVIRDPRMPKRYRGTTNTDWTLNVDLAPTLLGAAGLEATSFMQGRDIAELYLCSNDTEKEGMEDKDASPANTNTTTNNTNTKKWKTNIARYKTEAAALPWRKDWFYEWNTGEPIAARNHSQNKFIDASFALVTDEWKFVYWPWRVYEQLFHRSLDPYEEHDILRNYYIHQQVLSEESWRNGGMSANRSWYPQAFGGEMEEWRWMKTFFSPSRKTPHGDSVQSTREIYEKLKARFFELKEAVLKGEKV